MMRNLKFPSQRHSLENLEPRRLFTQTYDFANLTGFGLHGHSWKFASDYAVTSNVIDDFSGSGSGSVSVKRQGSTTPEKLKVGLSSGSGNIGLILQNDSTGMSLLEIDTGFGGGAVKLTLSKTRLAPKSLALQQKFTDSGTFSGSFSGKLEGTSVSGKVSGKTSVSCQLTGSANVSVPAGDFSTIKGAYSVQLKGTLKTKVHGISVSADFSETFPETFWAVDGLGIVKSQSTLSTSLSALGQKASIKAQVTSNLTSYSPHPASGLRISTPSTPARDLIRLFSDDPVLPM